MMMVTTIIIIIIIETILILRASGVSQNEKYLLKAEWSKEQWREWSDEWNIGTTDQIYCLLEKERVRQTLHRYFCSKFLLFFSQMFILQENLKASILIQRCSTSLCDPSTTASRYHSKNCVSSGYKIQWSRNQWTWNQAEKNIICQNRIKVRFCRKNW